MASLKEKANDILIDKSSNLLPENIKENVEILGVTGSLQVLDTSDATATAMCIVNNPGFQEDTTAYANGEKITGTLYNVGHLGALELRDDIYPADNVEYVDNSSCDDKSYVVAYWSGSTIKNIFPRFKNMPETMYQDGFAMMDAFMGGLETHIEASNLANAIGLTADKIKAGETILGITGTYEGN